MIYIDYMIYKIYFLTNGIFISVNTLPLSIQCLWIKDINP